jgi:hypothetical protein
MRWADRVGVATLVVASLFAFAPVASASGDAPRLTIWDLPLGTAAGKLRTGFVHFACGSNGGPPLKPLSGWSDFVRCDPEPDGLREVYLEYDDSREKAALAAGRWLPLDQIGTLQDYFPVMASVLFAQDGTLVGLRLVTDPRPDEKADNGLPRPRPRGEHYLLALYLMPRFGMTDADCRELPPGRGESPVIGQFVKRECTRDDRAAHRRYTIVAHYLRKPGQHDVDPATGQLTEGQFESFTRAEVRLLE